MKMVPRDCKKMTNNELKLYKLSLENEFEAVKSQINELEDRLDELDREYVKAEREEETRRTAF